MASSTRQTIHPIFGKAQELPLGQLPTQKEVFLYYELTRLETTISGLKPLKISDTAEILVSDVLSIWNRATIPTFTFYTVQKKIIELVTKVRNLMKVYQTHSDTETFKFQVMQFNTNKLFDICSCPCFANFFSLHETIPQSKEISTQLCRCNSRIPINQFEIHFY